MLSAQKLREENIAEYLLYMWQTEDILRAYECDEGRIERELIPRLGVSGDDAAGLRSWYAGLCEMMRSEGVRLKGHLRVNKNVLDALDELSARLLKSENFPRYREAIYKILPYLAEVRSRGERKDLSDIENAEKGNIRGNNGCRARHLGGHRAFGGILQKRQAGTFGFLIPAAECLRFANNISRYGTEENSGNRGKRTAGKRVARIGNRRLPGM